MLRNSIQLYIQAPQVVLNGEFTLKDVAKKQYRRLPRLKQNGVALFLQSTKPYTKLISPGGSFGS